MCAAREFSLLPRAVYFSVGSLPACTLQRVLRMPTRYLKPGICDSDRIDKCDPLAETLWYRLLVNVDDYGRLDARPAVVKARCFPLKEFITNDEVEALLRTLAYANLIQLYTDVCGCRYLQICLWDNVPRSKESKFPPFDETCIQMYTDVQQLHTNLPVTGTVTETVNRKQKPETGTETETRKKNAQTMLAELGVEDQPAKDWLDVRKAKRAPLTKTALEDLVREAEKAGITVNEAVTICARRSWQGFNASWDWKGAGKSHQTPDERRMASTDRAIADWLGEGNTVEGECCDRS
jgi:hypothetical protein